MYILNEHGIITAAAGFVVAVSSAALGAAVVVDVPSRHSVPSPF